MSEPATEFVDANVLIRHFTQDVPDQAKRATAYLEMVGLSQIHARMTEASIAEAIYVLVSSKTYKLPRTDVANALRPILGFPALLVPSKGAILRALDLWATTKVDLEDALNVAHAERLGVTSIVSFDRDYDRFPSVTRREP